jgi:hypothetical protein
VRLREKWTATREAIQHRGWQRVARLWASVWWELARQPWLFWVAVGAPLLVVIGVVWGMAMGLLSVGPALVFFVALVLLVARLRSPSGDLMGASLGYRMFEVLFRLAASYIPAHMMFALVTDLPRHQDLNHIRPFLASQTAMLAGDGQAVLAALQKAAGHEAADPPTQETFVDICKRIHPLGSSPMVRHTWPLTHATWLEFLFDRRQRSAQTIETLFRYMTYLDPEHKRLIRQIDNNSFFAQLDELRAFQLASVPVGNTDLSFLADSLFRYYRLTHQLQQKAHPSTAAVCRSASQGACVVGA